MTKKPLSFVYLALVLIGLTNQRAALGQVFPSFPGGTGNTTTIVEYAPSMVQFGSGLNPNALFLAYVNATR